MGGYSGPKSVEFWSASNPEQGSCVLNNYPREMKEGSTVDLVNGSLVACYLDTCEIYQNGSWQHLHNTTVSREYHSSVTTDDALLLIGGGGPTAEGPGGPVSKTAEWISLNGSAAQREMFTVRHGPSHCTIKISDDVIVLTGGSDTEDFVTQYKLSDGTETLLTSPRQGREKHACGVYLDAKDQQVSNRFCSIVSSDSGSFSDDVLLYIQRPLFEILITNMSYVMFITLFKYKGYF